MYRKYKIDETTFDEMNTEEKAYFLGFLYADGYMNDKAGAIVLQLAEEDGEILEKLNKIIKSSKPLQSINMDCKRKMGVNAQNGIRLTINSQQIYKNILRLGCEPRKTFTLRFPTTEQVPPHLIRHFIRGYFDGDGCLVGYFPSRGNGRQFQGDVKIVSTLEFVKELCNKSNEIGISTNITKRFRDDKNTYNYQLSGNLNVVKFIEWIYSDSNIFLKRKREKAIWFIKTISKRRKHKSLIYINSSKFLSSLINWSA